MLVRAEIASIAGRAGQTFRRGGLHNRDVTRGRAMRAGFGGCYRDSSAAARATQRSKAVSAV
jgi:hypothetical protein